MSTERDTEHHAHRNSVKAAQKFESIIGILMVIAIAVLAVGLVYGILQSGSTTPSYLR
jgi:hypothetical protein